MARGRAWGNALGGWRKQRRAANGRFGSGIGKSRPKKRKTNKPSARAMARNYGKTGAAIARTTRANYVVDRDFRKTKINRKNATKNIQAQHRSQVYAPRMAGAIGSVAGAVVGGGVAGTIHPSLGGYGAIIGGEVGRSRMQKKAYNKATRNGRSVITPQKVSKMSIEDQVLIARRNHRIRRYDQARAIYTAASWVNSSTARKSKRGAKYMRSKSNARADLMGIPAPGKATKLSGGNMNYAKRAGRSRKNRNVYVVTTMR